MGTRPSPFSFTPYTFVNKINNITYLMTYVRINKGEIFLPNQIGFVSSFPENVRFKNTSQNKKFINIREEEIFSMIKYELINGDRFREITNPTVYVTKNTHAEIFDSIELYHNTITPIINNKQLLYITNSSPDYEKFWFKDFSLNDRIIFHKIIGKLKSPIINYYWQDSCWNRNRYDEYIINNKVIDSSINKYGMGSSGLNNFLRKMEYCDQNSPDGFNWDFDLLHKELLCMPNK